MEADVDVTDVECENGVVTVFAPHNEYNSTRTALTDNTPDIEFDADEMVFYQATHNKILSLTQIFNIDFQYENGLD